MPNLLLYRNNLPNSYYTGSITLWDLCGSMAINPREQKIPIHLTNITCAFDSYVFDLHSNWEENVNAIDI